MQTPSKAWVRVRSPSTTFTATRTVSPGDEVGHGAARRETGDLLGLVLLDDVHRSGPSSDFLKARLPAGNRRRAVADVYAAHRSGRRSRVIRSASARRHAAIAA